MSARHKQAIAEVETDDAYGTRIRSALVCDCGLPNPTYIAPGSDGLQVNLFGESADQPGCVFTLTRERPARGWCSACWPWRPKNDEMGAEHSSGCTQAVFTTRPRYAGGPEDLPPAMRKPGFAQKTTGKGVTALQIEEQPHAQ